VEFRILGPLEVLDDGRALDLGGAKLSDRPMRSLRDDDR
jgi:hypothetical protein